MTTPEQLTPRPAAFLDRDGTIIVERDFLGDPDGVELLPGSAEAIRLLNLWGYWVIGVSNQSGVARGYYGIPEVEAVNERVIETLAQHKACLNRIYFCTHHPEIGRAKGDPPCECRKPAAGMVEQARSDYPIDLERSFVVGDQPADVGLGRTVGIPGILVRTGFGKNSQNLFGGGEPPEYIAEDLLGAVKWMGKRLDLPLSVDD